MTTAQRGDEWKPCFNKIQAPAIVTDIKSDIKCGCVFSVFFLSQCQWQKWEFVFPARGYRFDTDSLTFWGKCLMSFSSDRYHSRVCALTKLLQQTVKPLESDGMRRMGRVCACVWMFECVQSYSTVLHHLPLLTFNCLLHPVKHTHWQASLILHTSTDQQIGAAERAVVTSAATQPVSSSLKAR